MSRVKELDEQIKKLLEEKESKRRLRPIEFRVAA